MSYKNTLAAAVSFAVGVSPAWAAKVAAPTATALSEAFSFVNVRGKHTATNGAGLFISVWAEGTDIYARYTQNGTTSGDKFLVANDLGGINISVTMNSSGDAVVAWEGANGVTAQIIPANTTLLTPTPIPVGEGNTGTISVSMDDDGDFVVGWSGTYAIVYPDTDGDGIYDKDDACPTQGDTLGFGVNSVGCPLAGVDTDGDDIIDSQDSCPADGDAGYGVDPLGCPYLDGDGDTIPDHLDHCPLEGDAGYGIDAYGCPVPNPDPDGDGIVGSADHCPTHGDEGYGVDTYGCPMPVLIDTDGDGLGDANDQCPTVGDQGYGIDAVGCPLPPPPLFRANNSVITGPEDNVLIRAFQANGLPVSDRPTALASGCVARPYGYGGYYGYTPGCSVDVSVSKANKHGVVTWNADSKVIARRFNAADASLVGDEIRVDASRPSTGNAELVNLGEKNLKISPASASVAVDNSGNFTVAWSLVSTAGQRKSVCMGKGADRYCEDRNLYSTVSNIMMQRFNADNVAEKSGKTGNVDVIVQKGKKNSNNLYPQISVSRSGDIAIGWENFILKKTKIIPDPAYAKYFYSYDLNTSSIKAVRYSAAKGPLVKAGAPVTAATGSITQPTKAQALIDSRVMPSVALDDSGNLQILWEDFNKSAYPDSGAGTSIVKALVYKGK